MQRRSVVLLFLGALLVLPASYACAAPNGQTQSAAEKVKALFAEGLQRQQEKRYLEAIMVYRRALKLDPKQPEMLNNLGFCYERMKNDKKALEYYTQALALKPDLAEAQAFVQARAQKTQSTR